MTLDSRWIEIPTVSEALARIVSEEYGFVSATTSMYMSISRQSDLLSTKIEYVTFSASW